MAYDKKSVERVKRELPDVIVRWQGRRWQSRVSGRLNRQASVSPFICLDDSGPLIKTTIMGPVFHYPWAAVARASNSGAELMV